RAGAARGSAARAGAARGGAGRGGAGGSDRGAGSAKDSHVGRGSAGGLAATGVRAGGVGWCENTRSPVLAEQIRSWCGTPGTRVTVRPVIDLAGHEPTTSYEIPHRLREQVMTRDTQCVFPSCTRTARRCDVDHIVAFEEGGPTCGCNLAPLCRRHHRAKTHAGWTYVMVTPGTYLWTSPTTQHYLIHPRATFAIPPLRTCTVLAPLHPPSPLSTANSPHTPGFEDQGCRALTSNPPRAPARAKYARAAPPPQSRRLKSHPSRPRPTQARRPGPTH